MEESNIMIYIYHNFYIFAFWRQFEFFTNTQYYKQSESMITKREIKECINTKELDSWTMHERSLKNGSGRKWSKWARYPMYTSCNPLTDRRGTGFPIKMIPLGPRQDWFSELMTRRASLPHENQKRRRGGRFDGPSLRSQRYFFTWAGPPPTSGQILFHKKVQ